MSAGRIRRAEVADADVIGRLLHDFNTEFADPTPGPRAVAERVGELLESDEIAVLLAGEPPLGLAVLRLRPSLWRDAPEAYLEELYVVPDRRGRGAGRALMDAAIELARNAGAGEMHILTGENDTAARALYESLGFRGRDSGGQRVLFHEREL